MTTGNGNILERGSRIKKLLAISATVLIATASLATPSWAAVGGGKSIEVFHGIEFVGLGGYPATTNVKVDVLRGPNDVLVGSTTQRTNSAGELEINHVGGADCWGPNANDLNAPDVTPDIRPGDKVRTTILGGNLAGTEDFTMVRDIFIDQDATEVDVANNTLTMRGTVQSLPNAPINIAGDTLELRLNADFAWDSNGGRPDLRGQVLPSDFNDPNDPTSFVHVFQLQGDDAAQAEEALANGALEQAFEWSAGAAGEEEVIPEITVYDGSDLEAGDCPARVDYAITNSNPATISSANVGNDLVLSGTSFGASAVSVQIDDSTPGGALQADNVSLDPATGAQGWTATFTGGVGSLGDGNLTATATFTTANGDVTSTKRIIKDIAPPAVGAANLADASDTGELNNDDLTNDSTPTLNGTAEAGSTVKLFDGTTLLGQTTADAGGNWEFTVPADKALNDGTHAIKASATDGVGNSAESGVLNVTIDTGIAVVNASPRGGLYGIAQDVSLSLANAAQEDGTKIYFTLDESTPQPIAQQLYTGPINIPATQDPVTLKYRALDRAGNISDAGTQVYRFDTAGPSVSSKSPAANAVRVAPGANVRATFSESVTGVSGTTFKLKQGAKVIPATVTYSASAKTATLNPQANLARGTKYTVVLSGGIKDGVGNRLAATTWRFTTR